MAESAIYPVKHSARRANGARPKLGDVTVCVADTLTPALGARALEICLDQCQFGDAILFSDTPVAGRFRNVAIPRLESIEDYSLFCLRGMTDHIATDFALVVQWDGYVIDTSAWTSQFRRYDYIGAPIPSDVGGRPTVGNGGFSWRSRKLLQALPSLPFARHWGEDWIISSVMRPTLENDFGIRYAPVEIATRFSHEVRQPSVRTFGFHGVPNLHLYENDTEVVSILSGLPRRLLISRVFFVLVFNCLRDGRVELANALYALLRSDHDADWLTAQMARWSDVATARSTIGKLEEVLGGATTDVRGAG